MFGPYVHDIDPIIASIAGVHLWWYGFSYTAGFIVGFAWLRHNRRGLEMDLNEVYRLIIFIAVGVLIGGRAVEVIFYEWAYYGEHPWHIPAVWLGGMSTHGILLGSTVGLVLYCRLQRREILPLADVLAIAGAFIMGFGRLGNFVDGQIVGALTEMPWGVKFPDLEGFRHPVVLYDGIKNLLIVPLLLFIRHRRPPPGVILAHFILWYGFLRIFVDFFREYRASGFPPGQEFNILMTVIGIGLLVWIYRKRGATSTVAEVDDSRVIVESRHGLNLRRAFFVVLLVLPMIIPSDWTQDVPARYGARHPGLIHTPLYPPITQ